MARQGGIGKAPPRVPLTSASEVRTLQQAAPKMFNAVSEAAGLEPGGFEQALQIATRQRQPPWEMSAEKQAFLGLLRDVLSSRRPERLAQLDDPGLAMFANAAISYQSLVELLGGVDVEAVAPGLPLNAQMQQRQRVAAQLDSVSSALKAAGDLPALSGLQQFDFAGLKNELLKEGAGLGGLVSEQVDPKALQSLADSGQSLQRTLQSKHFAPERLIGIRDQLPPAQQAAFEKNVRAAAILADQALNAPDYRQTGMGWHNPMSRLEYQQRAMNPLVANRSEARIEASCSRLIEEFRLALSAAKPGEALERAVVKAFVREIGIHEADGWNISEAGVRRAIDEQAFLPLRALNETVSQMAPYNANARPLLAQVVRDITQHVLEGNYREWRFSNPQSVQQLAGLSQEQRAVWTAGGQTTFEPTKGLELSVRDEDDLGLLWLTKIGGPSHGFDVGGHCLLPALCNARTKALIIDDPRWPFPAARAYLRLLNVEGEAPQLYLEPLQIDFPYRPQLYSEQVSGPSAFEQALIEHAYATAKKMGLKLSLEPGLQTVADQMGFAGGIRQHQYVLEPSAGVFEASDTLSRKHDWVQVEREVTDPLNRMVLDTDRVRR